MNIERQGGGCGWRRGSDNRSKCGRVASTILSLLLLWLLVVPAFAQTGTQAEYEIKAAVLYKLLGYIEWPESQASISGTAFTIGVLAPSKNDRAYAVLHAILTGKSLNGRPITVRQISDPSEMAECQLVYISASERERMSAILGTAASKPVVLVGEVARFANQGGHINLVAEKNTINLEINHEAAAEAGFTISPQLLKLRMVKLVRS